MKLFDLTGQKALVTGANRGLGRGMAEAMLEAGASLAIIGRSDSIYTSAQELDQAAGQEVVAVKADLSQRSQLQQGFDQCLEKLGTLDILIVNHGIQRRAPAKNFSAAIFLAAEASNYVSGAVIPVDGGWLGR